MINDLPFVHTMKTPYGDYFFDVNTNNLIKVDKEIIVALKSNVDEVPLHIRDAIEKLKNEGLLSTNRPKNIIHPVNDYLEYNLNNKVKKITLQITQKCNFRCAYCVYSEALNDKQRKHSLKSMDFEKAKTAIDFLLYHSYDQDSVNIGFYGGEPLLEFKLIKECVKYSEELFEGKDLTFSITTNGSLLTEEIVDFLIEHKFSTMISLDGPKEIQDKQRRLAVNGCGSFDLVEKNLLKVKERTPEYFKKLQFSVVVDPRNDFDCVNSLFTDYKFFSENYVRSTVIDDTYSTEKIFLTEDYTTKRDYEIFKAFLYYFNRFPKEKVSPIALQEVEKVRDLENKLGVANGITDTMSHGGPCIPGALRLFINTDGDFYPCERVSELSDVMNIGNIDEGFNIEKARTLLNVASLTGNSCKNCWAISHCFMCAKYADNIKELSGDLKKTYCRDVRRQVEYSFRNYLMVNEIKEIFQGKI